MTKPNYKLAIIAPTCFYYQVALFRELAARPEIDLTVYFCSEEALYAQDLRKMYKTADRWGGEEELLKGFKYKFLRNYSPWPSYLNWPFGLINLGIWNALKREKPDAVILMSWANVTWWLIVSACLRLKIPFLYMTDANITAERSKPLWKTWPKRILLGKLVFPRAGGFLCAGIANKLLYQYYGVAEKKLVPFAYSWGYQSLIKASGELRSKRKQIRDELGIPQESFVILFCGRLTNVKAPYQLLEAFRQVNFSHKALVIVGDGELREPLQKYVADHGLNSVHFLGFRNRKEVPKCYAISDVLVLPSYREALSIALAEAMCFELPVIVSEQVGAGLDFVRHGNNGFIFPAGNADALADCITRLIELPGEERSAMGTRSLDIIKEWSQRDLAVTLVQCLDATCSRKTGKRGHGPV